MDRPRRGPPSASDSAAPTTGDLMEHAPSRQRRRRRHKAAEWLRRPASWAPALGVHDGSQQVRVVNASPVIVQQDEGLFQLRGLRAMCCVETPQQPTWTFITIRQDAKHRLDRPGVESPGLRPARPNVRSKRIQWPRFRESNAYPQQQRPTPWNPKVAARPSPYPLVPRVAESFLSPFFDQKGLFRVAPPWGDCFGANASAPFEVVESSD
ncbi:hypothetical protein B0T10DRAFT_455207 [Thelonectria olida]|uniref:Uncharacterized protein n=1 Tax=Thelonectria olida TaxID=1576542 RepID=A0A9P8WCX3_9HYPO|nr:hypothetical protein B0T10DRAFT_455207 [Thelonectria olida]